MYVLISKLVIVLQIKENHIEYLVQWEQEKSDRKFFHHIF